MLTTPMDTLNLGNEPKIRNIINDEEIYYSDKIIKIRVGLFSANQERIILITNKYVYNIKGTEEKRRIDINNITGITISRISPQFILHCKGKDDYDYLYSSQNRMKIIEMLEIIFEKVTRKELLFSIQSEKDLSKYIVGKSERKKKPDLFKIEPNKLMSIKEFIESEGNMNINSHLGSFLLEEEFNKSNNYKKESLDNFVISSIIGKGKSSTIYLAKYKEEDVVLKIFDKLFLYKNQLIERIILEKNILCSFTDNKFLCHMKFYFSTNSKIIFVLPFYGGGDLFHLLLQRKVLDEPTVAFYGVQIAYMLTFLHSKNIIYRDLKPENLMIDNNGYLVLIDFGSCKILESPNELESSFVGSTDYISPEIISGEGHNFMTDWWSYGILIYELLYGIPPFNDEKIERCFDLITCAKVRFPSSIVISDYAKDLILKLLNKNMNERLGKDEMNNIINLPFFSMVTPKNIIIQKTKAPIIPEINQKDLTANFDNIYTNMKINKIEEDENIEEDILDYFEDFEY